LRRANVDATGRLLACGSGAAVGQGDARTEDAFYPTPITVVGMAAVRVRSVVAGCGHSLALGWDGRVYSWGENGHGQLGHGDRRVRPSPAPVEGLEGVCSIAAGPFHSHAVTQSGVVFQWGDLRQGAATKQLRPIRRRGVRGSARAPRVC
jgi:hypothetical protein